MRRFRLTEESPNNVRPMRSWALLPKGHVLCYLLKNTLRFQLLKNWLEFYAPEQGTHTMSTQDKIPKRCQCLDCKAKLTLSSYPCRCGKYFCHSHTFSDNHNCTHDFKADARRELLKTMSTPVVAEKIGII